MGLFAKRCSALGARVVACWNNLGEGRMLCDGSGGCVCCAEREAG